MPKILSGTSWTVRYPTSARLDDLTEPFRSNARRFIAALTTAGASVTISATLRPRERAYLMHWSFRIAREGVDPEQVPAMPGVDIEWVHRNADGSVNRQASTLAAAQMVTAYQIVYRPALTSRHTEGQAVDMTIAWASAALAIRDGTGKVVAITAGAKNGSNTALQQVGQSYGVVKLASDPPHWSSDGH